MKACLVVRGQPPLSLAQHQQLQLQLLWSRIIVRQPLQDGMIFDGAHSSWSAGVGFPLPWGCPPPITLKGKSGVRRQEGSTATLVLPRNFLRNLQN